MTTPTQPNLQPSPEQEKRIKQLASEHAHKLRDVASVNPVALPLRYYAAFEAALTEFAADFAKEKAELLSEKDSWVVYGNEQIASWKSWGEEWADKCAKQADDLSTLRSANAELEEKCNFLAEAVQNETAAHMEALRAGQLVAEDLANTQAKLGEDQITIRKLQSVRDCLIKQAEKDHTTSLALAAALKQAREALTAAKAFIQPVYNRSKEEELEKCIDAALAAPADLGMVDAIVGPVLEALSLFNELDEVLWDENGCPIDYAETQQNLRQLLSDLGGQPNR